MQFLLFCNDQVLLVIFYGRQYQTLYLVKSIVTKPENRSVLILSYNVVTISNIACSVDLLERKPY